jgi:hypothetical protein
MSGQLPDRGVATTRDDEHAAELARIVRIAELRERISSGAYQVDCQAVAQAFIERLVPRAPTASSRPAPVSRRARSRLAAARARR